MAKVTEVAKPVEVAGDQVVVDILEFRAPIAGSYEYQVKTRSALLAKAKARLNQPDVVKVISVSERDGDNEFIYIATVNLKVAKKSGGK